MDYLMAGMFGGRPRGAIFRTVVLPWVSASLLLCGLSPRARCQRAPINAAPAGAPSNTQSQAPAQDSPGTITGTILYETGVPLAGAQVRVTRDGQSLSQEVLSGEQGQFLFSDVTPGPFEITVTAQNFETKTFAGMLQSGQTFFVPQIVLALAPVVTEVRVTPPEEVAEAQVKQAEKQRVLGIVPNFYASYDANPVPLNSRQKFSLAWKSSIDPITVVGAAALAGIDQGLNRYPGYGQGAQGYGERFGADYADIVSGTIIGSAVFPSLLKQDPRYFYKGTGSVGSRILYALGNAVMCKGDNGHWQPNYSDFLGGVVTGSISNLYYPPSDRGVGLVFNTVLTRFAESAVAGIFQEFVGRRLTSNVPTGPNAQP
jgi:hypothetical protein